MIVDNRLRLTLLVAPLASLAVLAGAAAAAAPGGSSADVATATWSEHVAPILYQKCVTCHRPGQISPMSLLSYEEARPWAKSIRKVTHDRTMPPWFANPEHGKFVEDPTLSDEQIELLTRWADAGAPGGDLSKAPAVPTFSSGRSASPTWSSPWSPSR